MQNDSLPSKEQLVIPVVEETVHVEKQKVVTGKIKIEKQVAEINEALNVDLLQDEYTIQRVAVNQYVEEDVPKIRHEGETLVIPVLKEVMVKRVLLVEEVRISKQVTTRTEEVNMPLRKETVNITRIQPDEDRPSI